MIAYNTVIWRIEHNELSEVHWEAWHFFSIFSFKIPPFCWKKNLGIPMLVCSSFYSIKLKFLWNYEFLFLFSFDLNCVNLVIHHSFNACNKLLWPWNKQTNKKKKQIFVAKHLWLCATNSAESPQCIAL